MPKRIGNSQTPSAAGVTDLFNLKQHKNFVDQDIFPSTDNHVVNSLRLDGSSYLSFTPSNNTNSGLWTYSVWVKLSDFSEGLLLGASPSSWQSDMRFSSGELQFFDDGGRNFNVESSMLFRDTSSFYHIVTVVNSSLSNANDRIKIYVNGSLISFSTNAQGFSGTDVSGGATKFNNSNYAMRIGGRSSSVVVLDGYLATVNFIDGQALSPTDFGYYNRSTGQWKAKKYTGTYGANGFLLEFKDSSNIGKDTSGNGNDWSSTGFVSSDNVTDSPHNTFATWNPLIPTNGTFSKGNTLFTASSSPPSTTGATIGMPSGKWYCEILYKAANNWPVGIVADNSSKDYLGMSDNSTSVSIWPYTNSTALFINASNISWSGSTTSWANGDIICMQVDADIQSITIYKNNTSIGTVDYSSYGWNTAYFAVGNYIAGIDFQVNFGQDATFAGTKTTTTTYTDANGIGSFYYQPPAGALALCTQNIPAPAIQDPSKYFNSLVWTGSGNYQREINVGKFLPDFIWIKNRFSTVSHTIYDSIRGYGDNKILHSDAVNAESAGGASGYILSTSASNNSFKFSGSSTSGNDLYYTDRTGDQFSAWCWKAGGAPSGTTATNGSAMIDGDAQKVDDIYANSTGADKKPDLMSVSTKAGFSIIKVSFSNTASAVKIPHGLSKAPEWVMIKSLDQTTNWSVYHKSLGPTKRLKLNSVDLPETYTEVWMNTDPDQHVITIGNDTNSGTNWHGTGRQIIYAWHSVPGYSAFGSYTANNSSDNAFVYTGFRPAWLMIRAYADTSGSGHRGFMIWDNKRETFTNGQSGRTPAVPPGANPAKSWLNAQATTLCTGKADQYKYQDVDILSNGFKIRNNDGNFGLNSEKHLWFAFAKDSLNFTNSM